MLDYRNLHTSREAAEEDFCGMVLSTSFGMTNIIGAALAGEFIRPADEPDDEPVDNDQLLAELDKLQASLPDFAPAEQE